MMIRKSVIKFGLIFLLFVSCKNDKKINITNASFLKKNGDTNYFRITLNHLKDSFYLISFFCQKKEINNYGSFVAISVQKKDTLFIVRSSLYDGCMNTEPFLIIENHKTIRFLLRDSIHFKYDYANAQGIYTVEDSYKNFTDLTPIIFSSGNSKYELSVPDSVVLKLYTVPLSKVKDSVLVDSNYTIVETLTLLKAGVFSCNYDYIPDYCYIRIQKNKAKYYGWIKLQDYTGGTIRHKVEKEIFWEETQRKTVFFKEIEIDQKDW